MKYVVFFFLMFSVNVFSQQVSLHRDGAITRFVSSPMAKDIDLSDSKIKGSQYLQTYYQKAYIDGDTEPVELRYNAFRDAMEYQNNGELMDLVKDYNQVVFFKDLNKKFVCLSYFQDNELINGYLVELYSDENYSLYRKEKVSLFLGKESSSEFGADTTAEFKKLEDVFFLKNKNNEINEVPNSKNKFSIQFGEDEAKARAYLKENKVKMKKQDDIIELLKYLNNN